MSNSHSTYAQSVEKRLAEKHMFAYKRGFGGWGMGGDLQGQVIYRYTRNDSKV